MDLLLWVPAGSLILNNFINVNRSYAHINENKFFGFGGVSINGL